MKGLVAIDARLVGRDGTGDSTYWLGLLQGLSQIDTDLTFLLFSNAAAPNSIPQSGNFEWIHVPSSSGRWWSMVSFPLAARKRGAGAIHTQYNLSPLAGSRGVTTVHDVSFFIGPEWFRPKDRLLLQRGVASSVRRARRVITVSETSARDLYRFLPVARGKTTVTPLACSPLIKPLPGDQAKQIVSKELGVDEPYMLTVGTRWPRKNMSLAIEAAGLSKMLPLLVTGKPGWGEEQANEWTRATGYVTDEQLSALYSAAELYLAPSRYEGFGLTLLEAFACGCPVLCSAGGALPEVAGDAAHIQASDDPHAWAKDVQQILEDESKLRDLRERGLRRASEFSWTQTATRTVEAYSDVINNRS